MNADTAMDPAALGPLPPGRHGLSRSDVAASQRARLLRAIADVVGTKGYAATTIADVTRAADVSKKTFYAHFRDKEDCFLSAYDAFARYIVEAMDAAYRSARGSWKQRYGASVATYLDLLSARPPRSRALILEVLAAGPAALARRRQVFAAFEELLRGVHAAARKEDRGVAGKVAAELFAYSVGGVDELVRNVILDGRTSELPALADAIRLGFERLVGAR